MKQLRHFIDGAWIDGAWVGSADEHASLSIVDPATEIVQAHLPAGCAGDVAAAMQAARRAQSGWSSRSLGERLDVLARFADTIEDHVDELAMLECAEMGKPITLAAEIIHGSLASFRSVLESARSYPFRELIEQDEATSTYVCRRPVGVAGIIVPWNFTTSAVLNPLVPILACGNTAVVKPSEKASLSAVRLVELADFPAGVVNLVLGDHRAGAPLAGSSDLGLVHFTGSVGSGRQVSVAAAANLTRSVLELGGNDPIVIDHDVDPVVAARITAHAAFMNSGQICTSVERIYVHEDVADQFIETLVESAERCAFGDGRESSTVIGPLVDEGQRGLVHGHVTAAVDAGAKVLTGGFIPPGPGFYYPATVLTDVDGSMPLMTEETFGPVAPVQVVSSFAEGLRRAADSRFALGATVLTNDDAHIEQAEHAIPAGLIWINQWQGGSLRRVYEPGGDSGVGATGGVASFDAATRPATICHRRGAPAG